MARVGIPQVTLRIQTSPSGSNLSSANLLVDASHAQGLLEMESTVYWQGSLVSEKQEPTPNRHYAILSYLYILSYIYI